MSDFLDNLIDRTIDTENVLQPRVPSLYEPMAAQVFSPIKSGWEEVAIDQEITLPAKTARAMWSQDVSTSDLNLELEAERNFAFDRKAVSPPMERNAKAEQFKHENKESKQVKEPSLLSNQISLESRRLDQTSNSHSHFETVVIEKEFQQSREQENILTPKTAERGEVQPRSLKEPAFAAQFLPTTVRQESVYSNHEDWSPSKASSESSPTTINVTIGRIEVKAVQTATKEVRQSAAAPQPIPLNQYLRTRNGGRS